eukprot:1673656-Pyramimonas_sp.AAC.1
MDLAAGADLSFQSAQTTKKLLGRVSDAVDQARQTAQARGRPSWNEWLKTGIEQGARRVHQVTDTPKAWTATAVLAGDFSVVSDPLS